MTLQRLVLACCLFAVTSMAQAALIDDIEGYWKFDSNGNDTSPQNRNLTVNGDAPFVAGLLGQAIDFSGKDQSKFADRPGDDSVFDIGATDFSLQVWVNYQSFPTEQVLIEKWTNDSGPGWTLTKLANQKFRFHFDAAVTLDSAPHSLTTGTWNHLVARRDGSQFDLYLNNVPIISQSIGTLAATDVSNPLLIGRRNAGDSRNFSGDSYLDEVAFWSRALSDAEIDHLYNNGLGRAITFVPEPSTAPAIAVCGMFLARRRRRSPNPQGAAGFFVA